MSTVVVRAGQDNMASLDHLISGKADFFDELQNLHFGLGG